MYQIIFTENYLARFIHFSSMISFTMENCYVIRLFQFSIRLSLLVLSSSNKVYFVIAHEITHAFDDVGIQYDSQGSYKPLYDNETVSRFHNASGKNILFCIAFLVLQFNVTEMRLFECAFKKQVWRLSNHYARHFSKWIDCVRQQYSNYTIGNPNGDPSKFFRVDGNITLGENIADHGGLKIAEIAYEKWLATKSNGEQDIVLPALENFRFIYLQFLQKMV